MDQVDEGAWRFAALVAASTAAQNSCKLHEQCDSGCSLRIGSKRYYQHASGERELVADLRAQSRGANKDRPPSSQVEPLIASDSLPHFAYTTMEQPTKTIRLLKVQPAFFRADSVICELAEFGIDNLPAYGALSYCWGHVTSECPIVCNGSLFFAQPNLEYALKQLRAGFLDIGRETYIWADAICINQKDLAEKSAQIAMMEQVYSQAQTVYISLGSVINETFVMGGHTVTASFHSMMGTQDLHTESESPKHPMHYKSAFYCLSRPWFTRTWVIQEYVLANRAVFMFLGNVFSEEEFLAHVSRDSLRQHPERMQELMKYTGVARGFLNFSKILELRAARRVAARRVAAYEAVHPTTLNPSFARRASRNPLQILQLTRDFLATEPKDKIFGVMSLFRASDGTAVGSYANSVQATYQRFAAQQVRDGRAFSLFDCAGLFKRSLTGGYLPSWVPDWTAQNNGPRIISTIRPTPYSASGSYPGRADLMGNANGDDGLRVRGLVLYTIDKAQKFEPKSPADGVFGGMVAIRGAFDSWRYVGNSVQVTAEDTSVEEAFVRTILLNDTYIGRNAIPTSSPILDPIKAYELAMQRWKSKIPERHGSQMDDVDTLRMQAVTACMLRSFAITREGYIGLVPMEAQVGDVVAIILGASTPFILRPSGSGYLLVGDSYIHGLMEGEKVDGSGREVSDIILK